MANTNMHPNFAKQSKSSSSITATLNPAGKQNQTNASTIQYDHENYLELVAGQSNKVEKTASQICEEERARDMSLRAQDPAVLSGPLDLGPEISTLERLK